MYRPGHAGITLGLTSINSFLHVREQVADDLHRNEERSPEAIPSLRERLTSRLPHVIAAGVVTGTAVLTSTRLDILEKQFLGARNHRGAFHSVIYSAGMKKSADWSIEWIRSQTNQFCQWLGLNDESIIRQAIDSAECLFQAITDGVYLGQITHILGDIPTKGKGGIAALPLLSPLVGSSFTLNLIGSGSVAVNGLLWKTGIAVAFASWLGIGVYATVPRWPKSILTDAIRRGLASDTVQVLHSTGIRMGKLPVRCVRAYESTNPRGW